MTDYVQKVSGSENAGANIAPVLTGVTAGNALTLTLTVVNGVNAVPVDSLGQIWQLGSFNATGNGTGIAFYFLPNAKAGTHTVTWTAGSTVYPNWTLAEWPPISGVDVVGTFVNNTSNPASLSASVTTVATYTIVLGAIGVNATADSNTAYALSDPPSGFNSLYAQQNATLFNVGEHCEALLTSAQTLTAAWTGGADSTGQTVAGQLISFVRAGPSVVPFTQQTSTVGGTATFSPSYTGSPTSYQWYLNGSAISGATSASYTTPTLASSNNGGFYSVVATNTYGSSAAVGAYLYIANINHGMSAVTADMWRTTKRPGSLRGLSPLRQFIGFGQTTGGAGYPVWSNWFFSQAAATNLTPGAASVSFTGYAPTVAQSGNQNIAPGAASLTFTGYAPSIAQPQGINPGAASITFTGYAPSIAQPKNVAPGAASVTFTGYAPSIAQPKNVTPGAGSVTFTGYAPTVTQAAGSQNISPGAASVVFTGYAPTVVQASPFHPIYGAAHSLWSRKQTEKWLKEPIARPKPDPFVLPKVKDISRKSDIAEVIRAAKLKVRKDDDDDDLLLLS